MAHNQHKDTRYQSRKPINSRNSSARVSRISGRDRLDAYFRHHRELARESLLRQLKSPLSSVMTWLAIGVALSLPAILFVLLANAKHLAGQWDDVNQISVFLSQDVSEGQLFNLQQRLSELDDVRILRVISKEDALHEFKSYSSFGYALDYLTENPLPDVIVLKPEGDDFSFNQLDKIRESLEKFSQIDQIQMDVTWLRRLNSMIDLGENIVIVLAVLFGLSVLLVIGNTIRLTIENRREEIIVIKMVGGTNAFVRRPFLYMGIWFGLGGGFTAWMLVNSCLILLRQPVDRLVALYQSDFQMFGLGPGATFTLLVASIMLGLIGAWLAVDRHIKNIEPT